MFDVFKSPIQLAATTTGEVETTKIETTPPKTSVEMTTAQEPATTVHPGNMN